MNLNALLYSTSHFLMTVAWRDTTSSVCPDPLALSIIPYRSSNQDVAGMLHSLCISLLHTVLWISTHLGRQWTNISRFNITTFHKPVFPVKRSCAHFQITEKLWVCKIDSVLAFFPTKYQYVSKLLYSVLNLCLVTCCHRSSSLREVETLNNSILVLVLSYP